MSLSKYLFSKPQKTFTTSVYNISFPKGWRKIRSLRNRQPFSFFSPSYSGILQITASFNPNENYTFNIQSELEEQKKEYRNTEIIEVGSSSLLNWNIQFEGSDELTFHFIVGQNKTKLFITYIQLKNSNKRTTDEEFTELCTIISKINIHEKT